jgi:hypothetical protein
MHLRLLCVLALAGCNASLLSPHTNAGGGAESAIFGSDGNHVFLFGSSARFTAYINGTFTSASIAGSHLPLAMAGVDSIWVNRFGPEVQLAKVDARGMILSTLMPKSDRDFALDRRGGVVMGVMNHNDPTKLLTLRIDGDTLTMLAPPPGNMQQVLMTAPGEMWGFGMMGGAYHFDGTRWQDYPNGPRGAPRWQVATSGPSDIWILQGFATRFNNGPPSSAMLWRWDGSTWTQSALPPPDDVGKEAPFGYQSLGLFPAGPGAVYVYGNEGQNQSLLPHDIVAHRWDGSKYGSKRVLAHCEEHRCGESGGVLAELDDGSLALGWADNLWLGRL